MNAAERGNQNRHDKAVILLVRTKLPMLMVSIGDEGGQRPMPAAGGVASPDQEAKLAGRQSRRGWRLFLSASW